MTYSPQDELVELDTSHSQFLKPPPNPDLPPVSVLLRGVNLSSTSKYPSSRTERPDADAGSTRTARDDLRRWEAGVETHLSDEDLFWGEAERGGRDGWFVGHPLQEEGMEVCLQSLRYVDAADAEVHLKRLRAWGFTAVRLVVTWEALEHAGPGKYDEAYIDYLVRLLRQCRAHGLRIYISAHQDVFSRFVSGSGAPIWVLIALGLNPRRLNQTGAAMIHAQWANEGWGGEEGKVEAGKEGFTDFPDMIWNTNLHRLASRHCFTMFFASETFAPKCTIDGLPAGQWAREKHVAAYGHLADRLRDAGDILDSCLIGWDSMNEPHEGFVGIPDLNVIPPSQEFRKGPSPSPIQGFLLGVGEAVENIAYDDFTSLGHKKLGKVTMTPPGGDGVWLTRGESNEAQARWGWTWGEEWDFWDQQGRGGCPWAGHGVWDTKLRKVLQSSYFQKNAEGRVYDYLEDFWRPHYEAYVHRIRKAHPRGISFVNPPVFGSPPDLSEDVKNGRVALSPHFYDGLTMLGKRRHKFNADAVGLQRGKINILDALKVGTSSIKNSLLKQFNELKSDASDSRGIAEDATGKKEYPTIIGELGVPFDMKKTGLLGLARGSDIGGDYEQSCKSMDELLHGCDGKNALSYTLWDYEPTNSHAHGDGWNGENLSLFSYNDLQGDDDLQAMNPEDLSSLIRLGSRGIKGWCRPYPVETMGRIKEFSFDMSTATFDLRIHVISLESSRLWHGYRSASGASGELQETEGWTLIYLPFAHYLRDVSSEAGEKRLIGKPAKIAWQADVPAVVDLEVLELSEGSLEVEGQWARWFYPLKQSGDREVYLKLRKWGEQS